MRFLNRLLGLGAGPSIDPQPSVMGPAPSPDVCEHEPSVTITAGSSFLEAVICPCLRCGELMSFAVTVPAHRPPLRLVPPLDMQADAEASRP